MTRYPDFRDGIGYTHLGGWETIRDGKVIHNVTSDEKEMTLQRGRVEPEKEKEDDTVSRDS